MTPKPNMTTPATPAPTPSFPTLKKDGRSCDRKLAYYSALQNDGWHDIHLELDTDDCDGDFAMSQMERIIAALQNHESTERELAAARAECAALNTELDRLRDVAAHAENRCERAEKLLRYDVAEEDTLAEYDHNAHRDHIDEIRAFLADRAEKEKP